MKTSFKYKHFYNKLEQDSHTTVRGATAYYQYAVNQVVDEEREGKVFQRSMIIHKEQRVLGDLPLEFLKADGEYPGFTIEKPEDFYKLLQSFRPAKAKKITAVDTVTVFWLHRVMPL